LKFKKSWAWFTGGLPVREKIDFASAEQHRKWLYKTYTTTTWKKKGYSKYRDQGAISNPPLKFKKPWTWFTGGMPRRKNIDFANAEQHREWVRKGKYSNYPKWLKEGYPKYKNQGAVPSPYQCFKKPWSWFTGNDRLSRKMADAEQHRIWFRENGYTQKTWGTEGYVKYKNQGAVRNPDQKFPIPWKWFTGNDERTRKRASAEQHKKWMWGKTTEWWNTIGYPKYKSKGAVYDPAQKYRKPHSWFNGNDRYTRNIASAEQHREWVQEGGYTNFKKWAKEGYPRYKSQGGMYDPDRKYKKPWSWFTGKKKK
jgi:hypothetical protein